MSFRPGAAEICVPGIYQGMGIDNESDQAT
jgi:hypothetical protein